MKNKPTRAKTPQPVSYRDLDTVDRNVIEAALRKGLSRRQVLKLIMATGVSSVVAHGLFLSGRAAMAQTPKKGGSIRVAANVHGPDDTLDPVRATSSIDYSRMRTSL